MKTESVVVIWLWLIGGLLVQVSLPVLAQDAHASPSLDAEALIKACWDISLEKRSSGNTELHREGALDTALCLEEVILDQSEALIYPGYLSREDIKAKLKQIRMAYGGLYWGMFMENFACDPTCGTMYSNAHNIEVAKLWEKVVRDMVAQRKEYGL